MSEARWPAFLLTLMTFVLMTFLSLEVDAQPTVDDSASCESFTLDEAVNLIREDLKDVKNLLGSNQQQCPPTEPSSSKQTLVSHFISELRNHVLCFRYRTC